MNMIGKTLIKVFGAVLLAVLFAGRVEAQDLKPYGFAGKDKAIYVSSSGVTSVRLGDENAQGAIYCTYRWDVIEQPEGSSFDFPLDKRFQSNPLILLEIPGKYLFQVARASKYGIQRELVTVDLCSTITLSSAIAKDNCYHPGELVRIEDFQVTTYPEGFEDRVSVHPDDQMVKPLNPDNLIAIEQHDVRFQIADEDGSMIDCNYVEKINVVDPDFASTFTVSMEDKDALAAELLRLSSFIEDNKGMVEDFKPYSDVLKKIADITGFNESFESAEDMILFAQNHGNDVGVAVSTTANMIKLALLGMNIAKGPGGMNFLFYVDTKHLNIGFGVDCCETKQRPTLMPVLTGHAAVEAGFTFDIGIPYLSFPGFGGLYVRGGLGLGIETPEYWLQYVDLSCSDHLLELHPYIIGTIALDAILRHPNLFSIEFGVYPKLYGQVFLGALDSNAYFPIKFGSYGIQLKDIRIKMDFQVRSTFVTFKSRTSMYEFFDYSIVH